MDTLTQQKLLTKMGGQFRLVTLFQKRARELVKGMPALVATEGQGHFDIVAREILEEKVELILGEEAEKMLKDIAAREAEEAPALKDKEKERKAKEEAAPAEPKPA
jgi:DNA-directed RNA polymerase subunit K/omega